MILAGLGAVALLTLDNWFSFLAFAFCYGLLAVGTIWFFYLNRVNGTVSPPPAKTDSFPP